MINKKIATLFLSIALSGPGIYGSAVLSNELHPIASTVIHSYVPAISIAHIHESAIGTHKEALKKELFYKKITRLGTKSLAALAVVYVLYSYINPWFTTVERPLPIPGVIPVDTGAQLEALWQVVDPSFFSWQWFKNNGKSLVNTALAGTVASAGAMAAADIKRTVFHPDSLEWYVQNKTNLSDLLPFQIDPRALVNGFPAELQMHMVMLKNQDRLKKSTLEELREYINTLDSFSSLPDEGKSMSIGLVQATANSMVKSLENILGFMAFKQELADAESAQEIEAHIRYVTIATNRFCDKLAQAVASLSIDDQTRKKECLALLNSFKGDLHRICMRFVAIEREQNI